VNQFIYLFASKCFLFGNKSPAAVLQTGSSYFTAVQLFCTNSYKAEMAIVYDCLNL
jgi:hypothetical protein